MGLAADMHWEEHFSGSINLKVPAHSALPIFSLRKKKGLTGTPFCMGEGNDRRFCSFLIITSAFLCNLHLPQPSLLQHSLLLAVAFPALNIIMCACLQALSPLCVPAASMSKIFCFLCNRPHGLSITIWFHRSLSPMSSDQSDRVLSCMLDGFGLLSSIFGLSSSCPLYLRSQRLSVLV